jgi:hypothetical protein
MKWTYRVPQKLVTSLLLSGALIMVLVNNLKERSNSAQLKTAFASIYEDRLMAESYILGLTKGLHQIQESLKSASPEEQKKINQHIANIEQINLLYLDTKLTPNEELHFTHFEKVTWSSRKHLKKDRRIQSVPRSRKLSVIFTCLQKFRYQKPKFFWLRPSVYSIQDRSIRGLR